MRIKSQVREITLYNAFTDEDEYMFGFWSSGKMLEDVKGLGASFDYQGTIKQNKYPDIELTVLIDSHPGYGYDNNAYAEFHHLKSLLETTGPIYNYYKLEHKYKEVKRLCDVRLKSIEAGDREAGGLLRVRIVFERLSGFYRQITTYKNFTVKSADPYRIQAEITNTELNIPRQADRFTYDISINGANADMVRIAQNLNALRITTMYTMEYDDGEAYGNYPISIIQQFKSITTFPASYEWIKFYLSNKNKKTFIRANSTTSVRMMNVYPYFMHPIFFNYQKNVNYDISIKNQQGLTAEITSLTGLNLSELYCKFTIYIWE